MSIKNERINSNIQREISYIVSNEVKNPNIKFITITACDVTSDLSYAKVYFTCFNEDQKLVLKELKKSTTQLINQHDSLIDFILLLTESIRLKEEKLSIIEYQSKNGLIKVSDYINEKINLNEAKINLLNQQINLLLIQKKLKILTGETKWKKDFY